MASKNVIIKRKIANEIFELLPKTSGAQVEVTYGTEVTNLAAVLSTVFTDLTAWNTFKADVDFAGKDSALDTLRELIDYLSDQEVATSIAGQLEAIKGRLDKVEGDIATLTQTVADNKAAAEAAAKTNADAIDALTQTVADNKAAIEGTVADNKAAIEGTVATLTQTVADNKAAIEGTVATLTQTVADNKAAAEAADVEMAGNIQANADAIAAIQGVQATQARVIVAEDVPEDLAETDLMIQIIG